MASFNTILRHLRNQCKLTQKQLAEKLGLSFSTISMYERGQREPDFETLESIADFFGVTMDYLYGKGVVPRSKYETVSAPPLPAANRCNTVRIIGRDGSYQERQLTDEQMEAFRKMIEILPDFKD
ncbi:MAG: helix-turn-helix transcriptional regulator [Clostridia bacterium]|nr:helix-turn-helix transcriptional regulator [Clostridia bacterium]